MQFNEKIFEEIEVSTDPAFVAWAFVTAVASVYRVTICLLKRQKA